MREEIKELVEYLEELDILDEQDFLALQGEATKLAFRKAEKEEREQYDGFVGKFYKLHGVYLNEVTITMLFKVPESILDGETFETEVVKFSKTKTDLQLVVSKDYTIFRDMLIDEDYTVTEIPESVYNVAKGMTEITEKEFLKLIK